MESLKSSKAVWQKPEQFEDKFLVTSLHQKFYERPIPKRDQHIHTLWEKIPDQSLLLKHLAFMLLITWLIWIWMYIDSNIWQLSTLPFISRCLFSGNHGWKKISCSMYQMSERIWRVSWTFCILWSSDQVILSRVCVLYVNGLDTTLSTMSQRDTQSQKTDRLNCILSLVIGGSRFGQARALSR